MQKINKVFCIVLILGPALFFGYNGKPAEMGLALISGSIAACFINLEKFSSFKGGGFEAQLREAKDTVDKAMVTVENLKNVISPLLLSTIYNITYMGRWGGGSVNENEAILQGSKEIIKEFDLNNAELTAAVSTYYRYNTWDAYAKIVSELKEEACCKGDYSELWESLSVKNCYLDGKFPPISKIETLIKDNGIKWEDISQNAKDEINRYKEKYKQYMESIA
jgi:hypothetical protein